MLVGASGAPIEELTETCQSVQVKHIVMDKEFCSKIKEDT